MVYLNAEEYGKLQNDLKKTGLTKSKYLRALIMGEKNQRETAAGLLQTVHGGQPRGQQCQPDRPDCERASGVRSGYGSGGTPAARIDPHGA